MKDLDTLYGNEFYQEQMTGSYRSARIYAEYLSRIFIPSSVVDIGCGRGMWLKAFKEIGAKKLVGFDGSWNRQGDMDDADISFNARDLNKPIVEDNGDKFDLAISLEVAEHLAPSSAVTHVRSLVNLSDTVLFGSAFTGQGGTNHINEQPHTYWGAYFLFHNYIPFDIFRPVFWGDERVELWYRQNSFLYIRKDSSQYDAIIAKNVAPISNSAFMDCIHPDLYRRKLHPGFRQSLSLAVEAFIPAVKRRFKVADDPQVS